MILLFIWGLLIAFGCVCLAGLIDLFYGVLLLVLFEFGCCLLVLVWWFTLCLGVVTVVWFYDLFVWCLFIMLIYLSLWVGCLGCSLFGVMLVWFDLMI